ncbi:LuxR C-terminal-related transcriptional regulator [Amycolatopsis sp. NPDC004079]|uniref:helix-turn-helix transcriptional regulator n=1 Tax=Amycolatopsis sp. NPDC004079 TaxID=3154549 RepID=UPI0033BB1629
MTTAGKTPPVPPLPAEETPSRHRIRIRVQGDEAWIPGERWGSARFGKGLAKGVPLFPATSTKGPFTYLNAGTPIGLGRRDMPPHRPNIRPRVDAGSLLCARFAPGTIGSDILPARLPFINPGRGWPMVHVDSRAVQAITTLVGRQDTLDELTRTLANPRRRLVNLCGVGGVGKTRVAAELHDRMAETGEYQAIAFVRLEHIFELLSPATVAAYRRPGDAPTAAADIRAPQAVPTTEHNDQSLKVVLRRRICQEIASALKLDHHTDSTDFDRLMEVLVEGIGERRTLLVLDNCEPNVGVVVDVIFGLLNNTPALQVVTTSRAFLNLVGEYLVQLRPLDVPCTDDSRDKATGAAAMQVFLDRAKAAGLRDEVLAEPKQWAAVVELVRMTEGLPLFLELLATQLRVRLPAAVLEIHGKNRLLSLRAASGTVGLPRQQQNLMELVTSHWDACTPEQQLLWARLSVFSGASFTLDAAEAVCSGGPIAAADVVSLLDELVSRSVVRPASPDGRHNQHGTLREYGKMKFGEMCEAGVEDEQQLQERHCAWVEKFSARAALAWFGPDEPKVLNDVRTELQNTFGAVWWCKETGQIDRGLMICTDVLRVRVQFFYAVEAEIGAWIEGLLAHPGKATLPRIAALSVLVFMRVVLGDKDGARRRLEEMERLVKEFGDIGPMPAVLAAKGTYELFSKNNTDALDILAEAAAQFSEMGLEGDCHMALLLRALGAGVFGPAEIADAATQECLGHALKHGSVWGGSWGRWATALPACSVMADVLPGVLDAQLGLGDGWGPIWDVEVQAWWLAFNGETVSDFRLAAVLLGGAIKLQDRHGVLIRGLEPFKEWRDKAAKKIIAEIGFPAYRKAYEEGTKLSKDEIFAKMLDDEDSSQPEILDPRELRIAAMKVSGATNADIAGKLNLTVSWVEQNVTRIYRKTGCKNRAELAAWFTARGYA